MPSPFPGMDPYLEAPTFWRTFHQYLVTAITTELNRTLPPGFAATIDERLYISWPDHVIYPDTVVLRRPEEPDQSLESASAIAVADPPLRFTLMPEHIREPFIEVRTTRGDREVITIIELLSPANKAAESEGRAEYLRKQHEVLTSDVHLLEIDLLRSGQHTIAIPASVLRRETKHWDYVVCLHRAQSRGSYDLWPFVVRNRLPRVGVPLTEEMPDTILDLQGVFDRCYDDGPFQRLVNYREEPEAPLSVDDTAWADDLLREKGRRS
jgi:hypothetical protein